MIIGGLMAAQMASQALGQKGQKSQSQQSSSGSSAPWAPIQDYIIGGYSKMWDAMNQGPSYFQGNTLADVSPYTTQGLSGLLGAADFQDLQAGDAYKALMQNYNAADVANNPYVKAMQDSIGGTMTRELREGALPAVNAGAALAGGIGGSRQALAQGQAIGRSQTALGDALANLNLGAYNTGVGARTAALQMSPQIQAMTKSGGLTRLGVGQALEQRGQQEIDAQRARFEYYRDFPMMMSQMFAPYITGAPMASTNTSQGTSKASGGGSGIMGLFS
jgi:hypothetical protein